MSIISKLFFFPAHFMDLIYLFYLFIYCVPTVYIYLYYFVLVSSFRMILRLQLFIFFHLKRMCFSFYNLNQFFFHYFYLDALYFQFDRILYDYLPFHWNGKITFDEYHLVLSIIVLKKCFRIRKTIYILYCIENVMNM